MIDSDGERRVLVLGAQGALGQLVARAFDRAGWSVIRGSRRPDPPPPLRFVDLDAPDTVAQALTEVALVINPVPDTGLTAERMVLERGGALVNLSALPASAGHRLRAHTASARGSVLMNAGVAPGLTNLVAADLLATHPDADEIEMVFTVAVNSTAGPAAAAFVHRGLTARTHHRTARVPLPAPFGDRRCLGFAEPDNGWWSADPAGPAIRTYVCFAEPVAHTAMLALNAARVISRLPHAALRPGRPRPAEQATREPVAHWVALRRAGRRIAARTIEGRGDFRMTGELGVMFADALLGRHGVDATPPGVWNPEDVLRLERLTTPLRIAGIQVIDRDDPDRARGGAPAPDSSVSASMRGPDRGGPVE